MRLLPNQVIRAVREPRAGTSGVLSGYNATMSNGNPSLSMAGPFIDYLARCSFLLQEGRPVADVCFYQGDGAPAFHPLAVDWDPELRRAGYDYDVVDVRVLTGSMSAGEGRIELPHGMSYALLVLPDEESIDPEALRKVRELVRDGATVLGPRPARANGLTSYPECDDEVRALADELWGPIDGVRVHAVSSGIAHDPMTDGLRAPARPGLEHSGPWRVRFQAGRGAPEEAHFPELISWTESGDERMRHFSGIAEYTLRFTPPADMLEVDSAVELDLGRVAGIARVVLNDEALGIAWKPPYTVDLSGRLRPGENELRCEVANTWHNRLVGDSALPPEKRLTRTNIRGPFRPETPLLESGLLGPVRLVPARGARVRGTMSE